MLRDKPTISLVVTRWFPVLRRQFSALRARETLEMILHDVVMPKETDLAPPSVRASESDFGEPDQRKLREVWLSDGLEDFIATVIVMKGDIAEEGVL